MAEISMSDALVVIRFGLWYVIWRGMKGLHVGDTSNGVEAFTPEYSAMLIYNCAELE
jgi:hypothetical protein